MAESLYSKQPHCISNIDGWHNQAEFYLGSYFLFNIWVSDVNPSVEILGYATFPGGSNLAGIISNVGTAGTDGVWIWSKSFGNTGTLQFPYNLGRTASHEIGHWLGFRHIGGDGNNNSFGDCSATDFCDDTPPQTGGFNQGAFGQNFGAPTYPLHVNVCSSPYGDMFMNFMDYTDDASNYMFTPDQNIRMQTAKSIKRQLVHTMCRLASGKFLFRYDSLYQLRTYTL